MVKSAGVLALQGDFDAHRRALAAAGARAAEVRRVRELDAIDGLVIPGGESTALLKLMEDEPWLDAIRAFHARGGAILGTCAGAILLARRVEPAQASAGILDVTIARNAYGRQVDSFEAPVATPAGTVGGMFIRAPRITGVGPGVEVLGRLAGDPVAVRAGRVLAATFHPELTGSLALHRLFLESIGTPLAARDVA
jgi:5'-phosphate synthase pdxT subunit